MCGYNLWSFGIDSPTTMNGAKVETAEKVYDPFEHRNVKKPNS